MFRADDLIASMAGRLKYISCFHPPDFIAAMSSARKREEYPRAKEVLAQILSNSRKCAVGRHPVCQDTGAAHISIRCGVEAVTDFQPRLQKICDEGMRDLFPSRSPRRG